MDVLVRMKRERRLTALIVLIALGLLALVQFLGRYDFAVRGESESDSVFVEDAR